jgi:hypothetical protein
MIGATGFLLAHPQRPPRPAAVKPPPGPNLPIETPPKTPEQLRSPRLAGRRAACALRRAIFERRGVDRLPSKTTVDHLNGTDDAMWSEWRGIYGNQQPAQATQGELAKLLEPFQVRPRSIRIVAEVSGKPTAKGYSLRPRGSHTAKTTSRRHNREKYQAFAGRVPPAWYHIGPEPCVGVRKGVRHHCGHR